MPASRKLITQFVDAARRGDAAAVGHSLEESAVRLPAGEALFDFDAPAIVFARRNRELVKVPLNGGTGINARSVHDSTPLDRAAFHGFGEIVELALAFGAGVHVRNAFGGTPLEACRWGLKNGWRNHGNYANMVHLLPQAGAKLSGGPRPAGMAQVEVIVTGHLEGDGE